MEKGLGQEETNQETTAVPERDDGDLGRDGGSGGRKWREGAACLELKVESWSWRYIRVENLQEERWQVVSKFQT